jgi:alkanesulfonate monooxygenase SsuD/methylene tetrahydromethanopterin reductase-like flavin-dependent oxidoreductase (luciferase family)
MLSLLVPPTLRQLDLRLTAAQLASARPNLYDPRSVRALDVAREGWPIRDVLAHGDIDYHPTLVGPASVTADHLHGWSEAGACDGFLGLDDVNEDGIDTFVDEVVPILQARGIYHDDYEGHTLRENLGAPAQYGLDPHLAAAAS